MALRGLVVVELANVLAGPLVGQLLGELGATVIKIESTKGGDITRSWKMKGESGRTSSYFSSCNWFKKSIAVDVKQMEGRDIVHSLCKKADIVTTSYKPGDSTRLQMDYDTLKALNRRLIYGSIRGYDDSSRAGYDAVIQAEYGFTYMNGEKTADQGVKMPVALIDVLTAHQLKEAILLQLYLREKTNEGGAVSASLSKSCVSSLVNQGTGYLQANKIPQREGSDHPSIVPYGTIFRDRNRKELVIAIGTDAQFKNLCQILGNSNLSQIFKTNTDRVMRREEVKSLIGELIAERDREEILQGLYLESLDSGFH
jgi:crotonobetainyl-CoA:carnitine CoA-transferase CaiB-like acyl-CoA transferase